MNPNPTPQTAGNTEVTPFLQKVAAPIIWIGVGYLLATIIQRPRRTPHA